MPSQNGTPSTTSTSPGTLSPWSNSATSPSTAAYSPPFQCSPYPNGDSDTLIISFNGFTIPAGSTIVGIGFGLTCYADTANTIKDSAVVATVGGVSGSNQATGAYIGTSTGGGVGYGGPTDTMGLTPSVSAINAGNISIQFLVHNTDSGGNRRITVSAASATVYYGTSVVDVDGSVVQSVASISATITFCPIDTALASEPVPIIGVGDSDRAAWQIELLGLSLVLVGLDSGAQSDTFSLSATVSDLDSHAAPDLGFVYFAFSDLDQGGVFSSAYALTPEIVQVDTDHVSGLEGLGSISAAFSDTHRSIATDRWSLLASTWDYGNDRGTFSSVSAPIAAIVTAVDTDRFGFSEAPAAFTYSIFVAVPGTNVYSNDGLGGPVNYSSHIASTTGLTYSTSPLNLGGSYIFAVRNYNLSLEEQNVDARVRIILDASGHDITQRPTPPTGLSVSLLSGGRATIAWQWVPGGFGKPTGFHVYSGTTGTPNYASPVATVAYGSGQLAFSTTLSSLTDGTTYTVGVRAYNATAEEPNTATITFTAVVNGPLAISGLTGSAVY